MDRKRILLAGQAAVTLVLLVLAFRGFDWTGLGETLQDVPATFYPLSLSVLALGQLLYALKWWVVVRGLGAKVAYRVLAELYFVGLFFNAFLPTSIGGDAARVYYLGRARGYTLALASVTLDRLFGFFGMSLFGAALIWTLRIDSPAFILARNLLSAGLAGFVLVLTTFALLPSTAVARWADRLPDRMVRLREAVVRCLEWRGHLRGSPLAPLAVISIVLIYYAGLAWIYRELFLHAGLPVPFLGLLAAVLAIGILSNIPVAINGVGLREQLHLLLLATFGISRELAVGASLLFFSQMLLMSALGGLAWLAWRARLGTGFSPENASAQSDAR